MNELQAIVEAAENARRQGKEALLATVVGVRGSAYRRPGARMLFTADEGWQAGSISGGCLEADILRRGWWHVRHGRPALITYDSTVDEDEEDSDELAWGLGLGCNGVVDILLERLTPSAACCPVGFIVDCLRHNRPGVLATVANAQGDDTILPGQRLLLHACQRHPVANTLGKLELSVQVERDAHRLLETGGSSQSITYSFGADSACAEVFLEVIAPPISLVICGAGHDAIPLSILAKTLGWNVTVVDPRPGCLPRPERFPGADKVIACDPQELTTQIPLNDRTLCVVMSHNVFQDAALLESLLPSPVCYIGVLGPRRRTERLLESLGRQTEDRLHGPVGLDIGADAPETIALSILSEMQAVLSGRLGSFLRNRQQPIHEPMTRHGISPLLLPTQKTQPVQCALTTTL